MGQDANAADKELLDKLKNIKRTVRRNFQDMVNLLTSVISLSSPYLGGHLRRVAEESKAFSDYIELPKEESYSIYYAGLLHDIGMIGGSEEYLTRKGDVHDPEETDLYEKHPIIGEEIVKTVYDLRRIGSIVRGHHENFNGEGFPDKLKGQDIPIGCRIVRIVNDYDNHLYIEGLSVSKAMDALFEGGGILYDPEILERFGSYIRAQGHTGREEKKEIYVSELEEGHFLLDDLYLKNGMLLMPQGVALNQAKMAKIHSFAGLVDGRKKIRVSG